MKNEQNPNRPTDAQLEVLRGQFLVYKNRWSILRDAENAILEAARTEGREDVSRYLSNHVAPWVNKQKEEALADVSDAAQRFEAALDLYRKLR